MGRQRRRPPAKMRLFNAIAGTRRSRRLSATEVNDRHSFQVSLTATSDSVETAQGNDSGKDVYRRRDLPQLSKGRLL
ncbi:Enolase [Trichinella spiralis]|uniref:Enolase n=1 Tax=Trichinella spiralis TaxID=6334 RepID=A0ABR3KYE6_TRISP